MINNNIKKILHQLIGNENTLSNNVLFIDFTGTHERGQLLSQMFYWSGKSKIEGGWVAKTYEEWYKEIRVKERTARRAIKDFENQGLIKTKVQKFNGNPTLHFKVDEDELLRQLMDFVSNENLLPDGTGQVDRNETVTVSETLEPDTVTGTINKEYTKTTNNNKESVPAETEELLFDEFRKEYPGTKRGNKTEFDNFKKKHKDWKDILPHLMVKLKYQKEAKKLVAQSGGFVPVWKNLQTWINNRCWEEEYGAVEKKTTLSVVANNQEKQVYVPPKGSEKAYHEFMARKKELLGY